jgi:SSS family transporter
LSPVDWLIVVAYLSWMIYDGLKRTKGIERIEGYFLADRSLPWWAVGLSVMATQLSAITLVGTTGQGYADGLRFVQFYFGLPLAMILLSLTVVPFFHRARVFTAYEYLERRFDAKTRTLTSALFLVSRGMSCGVIIAAPAVILSIVLGWNLTVTVLAIGLPTAAYTMFGGVQAVTWTDVKQMVVIVTGLVVAVVALLVALPDEVSVGQALHIAGSTGRLNALDFRFTLTETYTFWSGLLGGLFLALSYFGCDQSQVQRYLTAKSVQEGRHSLMMSAFAKIPLQALVLFTGVLVFIFYLFNQPPMLFNPVHEARVRVEQGAAYERLEREFGVAYEARREAALAAAAARRAGNAEAVVRAQEVFAGENASLLSVRNRAVALVRETTDDAQYNDVNYVFPTFITTRLPVGLVGLMIAAIFAAAMSSIAAELNSLATASIIDMYRRHLKPAATDAHYLRASKIATGLWGLFACVVAVYATRLGSLIEVVNRFGSFFYGSILGVFILAILTRRATGLGAFVGLFAGMGVVGFVAFRWPEVSFLWYNVIGAGAVVVVGMALSVAFPSPQTRAAASDV